MWQLAWKVPECIDGHPLHPSHITAWRGNSGRILWHSCDLHNAVVIRNAAILFRDHICCCVRRWHLQSRGVCQSPLGHCTGDLTLLDM